MKNLIKNNWPSFLIILVAFIWASTQIQGMPDNIPGHFDLNGNPDRYTNKYFILLFMPLINFFVIFLIGGLALISPKGFDMPHSQNLVARFNLGITTFLTLIYIGMILEGKGVYHGIFQKMLVPGFSLFMIFMGNYFGKLERNFFIGIRLPWTLASEENWKHTHRFAGKIFVLGGLIGLLFALLSLPIWPAFAIIIMASFISIGYSFYYFVKNEKTPTP